MESHGSLDYTFAIANQRSVQNAEDDVKRVVKKARQILKSIRDTETHAFTQKGRSDHLIKTL